MNTSFTKKAKSLLSDQTQKNYEIIWKIISNHWTLDENSLQRIHHSLFVDPLHNVNKEIVDFLSKHEMYDLRAPIGFIDGTNNKDIKTDIGFHILMSAFYHYFINMYNSTRLAYDAYSEKKFIMLNGQYAKIGKAIKAYYKEHSEELRKDRELLEYVLPMVRSYDETKGVYVFNAENVEALEVYKNVIPFLGRPLPFNNVLFDTRLSYKRYTEDMVIPDYFSLPENNEEYIQTALEIVGVLQKSSKDFHIYGTLNFVDWFLSATGEKWKSCVSLNSDNKSEEAFWTGLPGLLANPNRFMVFTNHEDAMKTVEFPKKNIIKTMSLSHRIWIEHAVDMDNIQYFVGLKQYPTVSWNILKYIHDQKIPFTLASNFSKDMRTFTSVHWFEPFSFYIPYLKEEMRHPTCYSYQDLSMWKLDEKAQKVKTIIISSGMSGHHWYYKNALKKKKITATDDIFVGGNAYWTIHDVILDNESLLKMLSVYRFEDVLSKKEQCIIFESE